MGERRYSRNGKSFSMVLGLGTWSISGEWNCGEPEEGILLTQVPNIVGSLIPNYIKHSDQPGLNIDT